MVSVIGSPISTSTGFAETARSKSPIAPVKFAGCSSVRQGQDLKNNFGTDRDNWSPFTIAKEAVDGGVVKKRISKKSVAAKRRQGASFLGDEQGSIKRKADWMIARLDPR